MDFISGLPKSHRLDVILVVVDRLSKGCNFIGLSHPFSSKDVATAMNREVVRLHGIPRSIVTDWDPITFWKEIFKATGKLRSLTAVWKRTYVASRRRLHVIGRAGCRGQSIASTPATIPLRDAPRSSQSMGVRLLP